MLDDLVDSSDLEHPEMLHPNGQKKRDPTLNPRDNDNPPIGLEEYRKRRKVKGSKACKKREDYKIE